MLDANVFLSLMHRLLSVIPVSASLSAILLGVVGCSSEEPISPREAALARIEQSKYEGIDDETDSPVSTQEQPRWRPRISNTIAPGFKLRLECGEDEKINGEFNVDPQGKVALPYGVTLKAGGKKLDTFTNELRRSYREYLVNPQIEVSIISSEYYVTVKGLVQKPGNVLVSASASLDEVIAQAGGLLEGKGGTTVAQYATITQGTVSNTVYLADYFSGKAEGATPEWLGGESVFLQSEYAARGGKAGSDSTSRAIKILGQVEAPGEYPYKSGADFFYYLIKAGGPTPSANLTNVALLRPAASGTQTKSFSLEEGSKPPDLKPGDTVMLYPENPSSLEKKGRVLSGFGGVFSAIAATILAVFAF